LRPKGIAGPAPIVVNVTCLRGTLRACPRGSLLAFSTQGSTLGEPMFLTAYLHRGDAGPRVWLLRDEPAGSGAANTEGLLPRAARIPESQPPADYTVEVLISRRPLSLASEGAVEPAPRDVVERARFEATVTP
jgi:hypothetical protein